MPKILKIFIVVFLSAALSPVIVIAYYLISERLAYQKVEITTALLRDGKYDPAKHFAFDQVCVFPPEWVFSGELAGKNYRPLDPIFPESHVHWTLILLDGRNKTFRTLYVADPKVRFGGQTVCDPGIELSTKLVDGVPVAYASTKNPQ